LTSWVTGHYIAKKFDLIRDLLPQAKRVAVLGNTANETGRMRLAIEVPMAAQQYGFEIEVIGISVAEDIPGAIAKAKTLGMEAVAVVGDPIMNTPPNRVPDLMAQAAIPAVYDFRDAAQAGGLISYGVDIAAVARREAHFIDRILRGASPATTPVEQPTDYNLVVNLKTAKALGLTIPPSLLSQANEVIE
jgi:putative tryptophan/tyrosine transport system substrate-binding protein